MVFKQIYLFLFLILNSFIVLDAEICSFETSCACSYCGEDGNFTKCNYINLFCEEGENYFTNQFKEYKEKYMNYFDNQTNSMIAFCGNKTPMINYSHAESVLIQTGKYYNKGSRLHCYYKFDLEGYYNSYYDQKLVIELAGGKNKLKFNLVATFLDKQGWYLWAYSDMVTDDDVRNNTEIINLKTNDSVEIYIDFFENQYSQIDELLKIKVRLDKKPTQPKGSNTDESNPLKEALSIVGALLLTAVMIFLYYAAGGRCDKNNCDCCDEIIIVKGRKKDFEGAGIKVR